MVYQQIVFDNSTSENSPTFNVNNAPFCAKAKLLSAHIPLSFDTTGPQNNTVAIRENGTVRLVTLKPGNYTAATFPQALKTALGGSYDVTYDELARNLKITNATVQFSILGLAGGTTAYQQLGKGRENESTPANSWQGTAVSNFTGTNSLLIVSSDLISPSFQVAGQNVSALGMIEINGQPNSYFKWDSPGDWLTVDAYLSYVRFRFLDARTLHEVHFRGAAWSLQMAIVTDSDDVSTY